MGRGRTKVDLTRSIEIWVFSKGELRKEDIGAGEGIKVNGPSSLNPWCLSEK